MTTAVAAPPVVNLDQLKFDICCAARILVSRRAERGQRRAHQRDDRA